MRKLIVALAALASVVIAVPAHADHTPGAVSNWELRHTQVGQTKHHVVRSYGTRGIVTTVGISTDGTSDRWVSYPLTQGGSVTIHYLRKPAQRHYRVVSFAAIAFGVTTPA